MVMNLLTYWHCIAESLYGSAQCRQFQADTVVNALVSLTFDQLLHQAMTMVNLSDHCELCALTDEVCRCSSASHRKLMT